MHCLTCLNGNRINDEMSYQVALESGLPWKEFGAAFEAGVKVGDQILGVKQSYTSQVLYTFEKRCSPKPFGQTKNGLVSGKQLPIVSIKTNRIRIGKFLLFQVLP